MSVLTLKNSSGGVSSFIALTDTDPITYTSQAGKAVEVNAGETGLQFGQKLRATDSPTFASIVVSPVTSGNVLAANGTAFVSLTPDAAGLVAKSGNQTGIAGDKTWTGNHIFQTAVDSTTGFQVLDANGGDPVFNVDTDNEFIGIGLSSPSTKLHVVTTATTTPRGIITQNIGNDANGGYLSIAKARGAVGSLLTAQSGDIFGAVGFFAYDGSGLKESGRIQVASTGTVGNDRVQSEMTFWTSTPTNPSVLTKGMTLNRSGTLVFPQTNGQGTIQWGSWILRYFNDGASHYGFQTINSVIAFENDSGTARQYVVLSDGAISTAPVFGFSTSPDGTNFTPVFTISNGGQVGFGTNNPSTKAHMVLEDSATNSIVNILTTAHNSTGTPTAGFGGGIVFTLESSTTADQNAVRLIAETVVATHASRTYRGRVTSYDYTDEREAFRWEADGTQAKIAWFGQAAVARPAALTQTYSTADRTLSAYTPDSESGAYTGIDNAQAGTPYAQLTDLNALRVAYENLRAFTEDGLQFLNALVDDMQAYALEQ